MRLKKMATSIDCRAYYIDRDANLDCYVNAQSSRQFLHNSDNNGDTGCGFSVSKYLIDRPDKGIEQNSSESATLSLCLRGAEDIVCNADNLANAVESGSNERLCGQAIQRPVRSRLRGLIRRMESFLREMKDAARDFIVHIDVTDSVHRQTTSSSTDSDNATVLENRVHDNGGYRNYLKPAVTGQRLRDAVLPHDRNWKSNNVSTYDTDNGSVLDNVLDPSLPEIKEATMTSSNKSADSNNNSRVYCDSVSNNSATNQLLCGISASGKTTPVRCRTRPCRMVTAATQTRKHWPKTLPTVGVQEVATCAFFRHRAEVVCTVATPRHGEVPQIESDQLNYSGVYERDLDEILESVADVNRHLRRRRRNGAAFQQRADKFYIRLPCSPEVQSNWASSDSCSGCSESDSELQRKWTSDDELDLDEDRTSAVDSGSFYHRLCFRLNGSRGPEMAAIEP